MPTCDKTVTGFEDNYDNFNVEHPKGKVKMGTIREELEESKLSNNGSDKGYFEDDNGYDS